MANLTGAYDPNAEASQGFSCVPTADYLMQIVESDVSDTDGKVQVELVHEVMDGPRKGSRVWAFLKTAHPNETTQRIGNEQFAAVRAATGVTNPRDTQELHYKPMLVRVEFIPAGTVRKNYTYQRDTNEIKSWKKAEGVALPTTAPTANQAPAAAGSAPPWANRAA